MSKSHLSLMIFYDKNQKRKLYFRIISFIIFSIFVIGFIAIASSIVNAKSEMNFLNETEKYYNYYYGDSNKGKIALTFDDGPHPTHTRALMDILSRNKVPATFFFLGQNALKHEDVVQEVSERGFTIGNHSFTHSQDVHESEQRVKLELVTTGRILEKITGTTPLLYRPPFLLSVGNDPTVNPYISEEKPLLWAARQGYIPIGADIDSKDWLVSAASEAFENIKKGALNGGHIVLLHDGEGSGAEKGIEVLEQVILDLKSEGYEFVSVPDLLGVTKNIDFSHNLLSATSDKTSGGRVSELQKFLREEGARDIEVSGYYNQETYSALLRWEEKYGVHLEHEYQLASSDKSTDGEVSRLQRFLKDAGESNLAVTGYYNQQTIDIMEKWQKKHMDMSKDSIGFGQVLEGTRKKIFEVSQEMPLKQVDDTSIRYYIHSFLMNLEYTYVDFVASIGPAIFSIIKIILILVVSRTSIVFLLLIYSIIKKKSTPKPWEKGVTAIVPAYNEKENIASTLQSLLRNKAEGLEIIVIDDGSTDDTSEIVEGVQKIHPGVIRLIRLKNGGKANALNVGFREAKNEVIVAMDGDTIYAENTIEKLVRHFTDPNVGAVAGKVCVVEHNKILGMFQAIEYIIGQNIEKQAFASVNAVGVVPGPVGAWRKADVLACGGYSVDTLVEDQDLTLSILKSGKKVVYDNEAIALTETPPTVNDFVKQRFRWVFGTMQCFWKYKGRILKGKPFALGWVVLPNIALYNTIIPLFSPFADILALFAIIFGSTEGILEIYLLFTLFDLFYASIAFRGEPRNIKLLLVLPLQRLFYRQIMYYIIIKSVIKAIEGTSALWNKVRRTGQAQKYFETNAEVKTPHPLLGS